VAQEFADKEYYLVDSLVLEDLSEGDMELLKSSLEKYHSAKDDTSEINALSDICENMMHENWKKFQLYQYDIINLALTNSKSEVSRRTLEVSLSYALNNLGLIYKSHGDAETGADYYKKSLSLLEEHSDSNGIAGVLNNLASIYQDQGKSELAIEYFLRSTNIMKLTGDDYGRAMTLNNLGNIYKSQGDIANGLSCYHKSLKLAEKIGSKKIMSIDLSNIAFIYHGQGDTARALSCFEKSLKLKEELGEQEGIGTALNNMGFYYKTQGNLSLALKYFTKSLKYIKKAGDKEGLAVAYHNLGTIYQRMKNDNVKGLEYYFKSNSLFKEIGYKKGIVSSTVSIGRVFFNQEKIKESEKLIITALALAKEIGYPEETRNAAELLSEIYQKQGKGMKALEMYKLYVQMKDSINNEETQKATIRQQTKYEFEKAQIVKENEAKEQARVLEEETSRRNNLQHSLIFLGILVLFGIVLSLGFIKVSPNIAEGLIFFAFLILFEFVLVLTEPYLEQYTNGEPMYNLLANSVLALVIFPLHAVLENLLKKRIVK